MNYHKILITDIITQKKKGLASREDVVDEDEDESKGATGGGTNIDLEEKEQDIEEEEEEEESSSDEDVRLLQQYVVLSLVGIRILNLKEKVLVI